jgi:hypothetical protein
VRQRPVRRSRRVGAGPRGRPLYSTIRHARIPRESAAQFWRRVEALIREFTELPRSGDTVYGFVAGLYPTDHPTLPDPD